MSEYTLSVIDYIVFALVLIFSSLIGIYFARRKTTAKTGKVNKSNENNTTSTEKITLDEGGIQERGDTKETDEYLVGGRNIHWFPLSISFMATYISASTLLGIPAEIYTFGFQYVVSCGALFVSTFFTWYIFIPIFYRLKIVCANEVRFIYNFTYVCKSINFLFTILCSTHSHSNLRRKVETRQYILRKKIVSILEPLQLRNLIFIAYTILKNSDFVNLY